MTRRCLIALWVSLGFGASTVSDMSGTWRLNLKKSSWGKHPQPISEQVTIVHHEPALKYSGAVVMPTQATGGGEETRKFSFEGAIDGKPYPVSGPAGEGVIAIRRVDDHATVSEFRSHDGKLLETAKTTVSSDGKTLTRELKGQGPGGDISWKEVYDRQ